MKKEKRSNPEAGGFKFYACHTLTHSYTAFGADNHHHAFNKATKLWKGLWNFITNKEPNQKVWTYITVKEFNAVIKEHLKANRRD